MNNVLGKIDEKFFNEVIYPRLGAEDDKVIVKPQHGVDFGVVDFGEKVLVMSTDPFFIQPSLGLEKAAWFAVHILASDVAVSGIKPSYLAIDLNLPPEISDLELERIWSTVDKECKKLGISVVTGHTARYAGCNYPMVGGATVFGIDYKEKLIVPKPRIGDAIVISKGPAIEATALMANQFPDYLEAEYGKEFTERAKNLFYQMSVVEDALTIAAIAGKNITAMHDATEYGVFGALCDIAQTGKVGLKINLDYITVQEEVAKVCRFFNMNPYEAISEGTLVATVNKDYADKCVDALSKVGIKSSIAGEITERKEGLRYLKQGREYKLERPNFDPYWLRFEEYLKKEDKKQK